MRALLIEFDIQTGKRAGGINPRDPGLICYGWQNLDRMPALEIRLVVDNRNISQYERVLGVKVLHNDNEIDSAIEGNIPPLYAVEDDTTFKWHCEQRKIKLDKYSGKTMQEIWADLYADGIAGIRKTERLKMKEVKRMRQAK